MVPESHSWSHTWNKISIHGTNSHTWEKIPIHGTIHETKSPYKVTCMGQNSLYTGHTWTLNPIRGAIHGIKFPYMATYIEQILIHGNIHSHCIGRTWASAHIHGACMKTVRNVHGPCMLCISRGWICHLPSHKKHMTSL